MALKAHLEPSRPVGNTGESESKRSQPRRSLRLETSGVVPGGLEANVTIHNLSAAGLLLETDLDLAEGDSLAIDLPESGPVDAVIVWQSNRLFGCAFEETLPRAALAAAQLRGMDPRIDLPDATGAVPGALPLSQGEPFGMRLNRLRRERGLTLAEVAAVLGVSKPTVWAWEKGKAKPLPERLDAIAAALGVPSEELSAQPERDAGLAVVQECRLRIASAFGTLPRNIRIMIELDGAS
ncbi:helix-turn-helix domain-containing protein [Erythrobacter sp.]|uniref:helix-turn-helix domain-containing protein n=1 Tax=Erythrobacter sp. TaxID=1042 RepID=UPI001425E2D8|nr:helix-turn-helix domain-containing protein [Erythrobacter sp.]QIQ87781.1 MAG: helix-turn-helix domain-containing protein [Erythrobacter sp.]